MGSTRRGIQLTGAVGAAALVLLLLADPALAQAARAAARPASHEATEAGRWSLVIALVALGLGAPLLLALADLLTSRRAQPRRGRPALPWHLIRGVFVGHDNRISTSKTVAAVWTFSVASALLSLVIAKWMGHGGALAAQEHNGLQSNYGLLIGGPLGAAILAKGVVTSQTQDRPGSKAGGTPAASQLVANDQGDTDLGDLQYVLFNLVALIFFFGELWVAPSAGLPNLPNLLVGLTSVSAVGYVGKKTLPSTTVAITSVEPARGAPGSILTIAGPGLAAVGEPPRSVSFDATAAAPPFRVVHTPRGPVTRVTVPTMPPAGDVTLRLTTHAGVEVTWRGFEVTEARPAGPAGHGG